MKILNLALFTTLMLPALSMAQSNQHKKNAIGAGVAATGVAAAATDLTEKGYASVYSWLKTNAAVNPSEVSKKIKPGQEVIVEYSKPKEFIKSNDFIHIRGWNVHQYYMDINHSAKRAKPGDFYRIGVTDGHEYKFIDVEFKSVSDFESQIQKLSKEYYGITRMDRFQHTFWRYEDQQVKRKIVQKGEVEALLKEISSEEYKSGSKNLIRHVKVSRNAVSNIARKQPAAVAAIAALTVYGASEAVKASKIDNSNRATVDKSSPEKKPASVGKVQKDI